MAYFFTCLFNVSVIGEQNSRSDMLVVRPIPLNSLPHPSIRLTTSTSIHTALRQHPAFSSRWTTAKNYLYL